MVKKKKKSPNLRFGLRPQKVWDGPVYSYDLGYEYSLYMVKGIKDFPTKFPIIFVFSFYHFVKRQIIDLDPKRVIGKINVLK